MSNLPPARSLPLRRAAVPVVALLMFSPLAPPAHAQETPPANAPAAATTAQAPESAATLLVTAIRGTQATLGGGANNGVQVGAIYGVMRGGTIRARLRVTSVRQTESTATIFDAPNEFIVTVGDPARFLTLELPGTEPATPATPDTPPTPETPPVTPPAAPPTTPETPPTVVVPPTPPATGTVALPEAGATAVITAVAGDTVTVGAGANQGVRAGSNLPVVREGNVVAVVRVQTASPDSSTGIMTWSDDPNAPPVAGDTVRVFAAPGRARSRRRYAVTRHGYRKGREPLPAAPMLFESGLSNAVVPRADRTYEHLAALAASRLITRYPPHVFHDDGTRRHRTEEDLATRAENRRPGARRAAKRHERRAPARKRARRAPVSAPH